MRRQGESQVPTAPLISSVELCQAAIADKLDQVYIVIPVHSFLFVVENENNSSSLNDVSIVEIVIESGLNVSEQTKDLGRNPCFDKPVLTVCAHPKIKAEIDEANRYADILGFIKRV